MGEFGEIPDLYGKLNLLIKHGLFPDWNALGSFFGNVRGKTVIGWGFENGRQRRNHVPLKHQKKFEELFEKSLPDVYGSAQLHALILGPTERLDLALKTRKWKNLNDLIDEEGNEQATRLIVADDATLGAIRFNQQPSPKPHFKVPRSRDFRLEFETAFFGENITAFYRLDNVWFPCPATIDGDAGTIHVPGLQPSGRPSFMREDEVVNSYRFVVMQCRQVVPEFVVRATRQDTALDTLVLQDVVDFYCSQKIVERRLFFADIQIVDHSGDTQRPAAKPVFE